MLAAGLDMEMPGTNAPLNTDPAYYSKARLKAVASDTAAGESSAQHVTYAANRIVTAMSDMNWLDSNDAAARAFEDGQISADVTSDAHRDLARKIAEESLVLLKNGASGPEASTRSLPLPAWCSQSDLMPPDTA